ncbi:S8 family serine peptidase [bacterium]|nr:S8 family serine peptidase [bacterium]
MKKKNAVKLLGTLIIGLLIFGCASQAPMQKIAIEKLDDLPRYTYTIDVPVEELFDNEAALMKLADAVEKDLRADLAKYEIQDHKTLQNYYQELGTVALLKSNYDEYMKYLKVRKDLEAKEALEATMGIYTRAYILAKKSGATDFETALRDEYASIINTLPYDLVADELKGMKGNAEIVSKNLLLGVVEVQIQPILDESGGEMSKDIATQLLSMAYSVNFFMPYKHIVAEELGKYLDAHKVDKPDIWEARDIALEPGKDYTPVIATVWDSGVDTDIFEGQRWTNKAEIPGNGKDDDNNGYVDDVHGIAYSLHSDKTPDLLYPIGSVENRPKLQRLMKGLTDITAAVESEEATELKQIMSQMERDQVQPFIEDIGKYGNYSHGTHVAGITASGNPYVRIMAARLTFSHEMVPEEPTIEQATKDAKATVEAIEYFKKNGSRVVNMSWGGNLASIEGALEANNAGGTPEERKALAREIFEITRKSLYDAIKNAPDILFVTSAGNADSDVRFEEFYPSSFDLPNIISVGAVDQAGDETSFTSFGKVDVYGNGFEVLSYVPGGDKMKLSGTSMSSPQVTGVAAKLLAVNPKLTVAELRNLIIKGADEKQIDDRTILLLNPKKSVEMAKKSM